MKQIEFKIPIYGTGVDLIVNCSEKEACDYFNQKYGIDLNCNNYAGFNQLIVKKVNGRINLVWIEKFDWTIDSQKVLAHELSHSTFRTLEEAGVLLDYKNQEAYCYLFDYIYGEALSKLKGLHKSIVTRKPRRRKKRLK
jgi:hypothetical protein